MKRAQTIAKAALLSSLIVLPLLASGCDAEIDCHQIEIERTSVTTIEGGDTTQVDSTDVKAQCTGDASGAVPAG
ncbi:MAG TPA: hypothetical protein VGV59_11845 [Pyrinomonadaceae bacterium]|nr:hypothetical protein [Pyrinomonadaceae bacterium]